MNTKFMNSEYSKTSDPNRLTLNITDTIQSDEHVVLSICYTCKNIKRSYNRNKFKISESTGNEEFEFPNGSYSVSDIQNFFEHIIKKHETQPNNHLI